MPREIITIACEKCRQRNYTLTKNKRKHPDRVAYKKFCPFCDKHTTHKETR